MIKKHLLILLLLFLSFIVHAQQSGWEQKKIVVNKVDSLIYNYSQYAGFTKEYGRADDEIISLFHELFANDATIFDDMVPSYLDGDNANKYALKDRSVKEYTQRIKDVFPNGLNVKVINANINYSGFKDNKTITVLVEKQSRGTTSKGLILQMHDTVSFLLKVSNDFKNVKINKISRVGFSHNLMFINDQDRDFVNDEEDKCKYKAGPEDRKGCPPYDWTNRIYANVIAIGGLNNFTFQDLNPETMGYSPSKLGESNPGKISQKGMSSAFGILAEGDFYFNKRKNLGVGLGLGYMLFNTSILLDGLFVEYSATHFDQQSGDTYKYKRRVRANAVEEDISLHFLAIPLSLKYKGNISGNWGYNFAAGVTFMALLPGSKSSANANFDYEAIIAFNEKGESGFSETNSNSDWRITKDRYKNEEIRNRYFESMKNDGYDVGLDENVSAVNEIKKIGGGFAFHFRPAATYIIKNNTQLLFGLNFLLGSNSNKDSNGYKLTDKIGDYNTLLDGTENFSYVHYGLQVGIKFGL